MANTPGKGTVLQIQINSTYTTLAQGVTITPFQGTNTPIDTTILTSTAKTFDATGIPDYGEVSFVGNWDGNDTTHGQVGAYFSAANSSNAWRINFADTGTATATFTGPVTAFSLGEATEDSLVQMNMTIKISGAVTLST